METDNNDVERLNVLYWLADTAKGRDRNPEALAHVEVLLASASVHTTLLRMVNVLYDLTANPNCRKEVEEEIQAALSIDKLEGSSKYVSLRKLDSVIRESQRM